MNKILLIEVWLGKIPDYYYFHLESMKRQNKNIDILLITDQSLLIDNLPDNYKIFYTNETFIKNRYKEITDRELNRKIYGTYHGMTISYLFDFFTEYIDYSIYDYVGHYDLDTIFGDIYKWVEPFLGNKEYISIGGGVHHNRLSGPFFIIKNTEKNKKTYFEDEYLDYIDNGGVGWIEENMSQKLKGSDKVEIIQKSQNVIHETSKVLYDCVYSEGKVLCNNENILCYHFIDKKNTRLEKVGNTIITSHKKHLEEDFYWITYLTESYEPLIEGLIDSIKKYSNRKCIFYTLNYDSNLRFKLDEQFIFRRIDIEKGNLDRQGRDINIISSKPKILSDTIEFIPNGKFIYIDTDIYLTNTSDNLKNYFTELDKYPLFNSHIHDRIMANDVFETGKWVSPIDILSEVTSIPVRVLPRRKTNVIVYDHTCKWFFDEQMKIYNEFKDTKPGVFRLHDEDSANILLSKYDYQKSLPLIDMEESNNLDINKFQNYSYNRTNISQHVILPKTLNEIYVFHGFKNPSFYKEIEENYGKTILDIQDFVIKYENNTISFTKNNFLTDKKVSDLVNFNLYKNDNTLLFSLNNQKLFDYWTFFISNIDLKNQIINIEVEETDSKRIIYKNTIKL